jgi:RNA polymerase sigma-70 factor (ECF subfamily)
LQATRNRHGTCSEVPTKEYQLSLRAADRIDVGRDPAPWLATIAKRASIDSYRRERLRPAIALADVAADDRSLVGAPPDLEALVPEEATIVRMQHLEGMTQVEISEQLGIALGTVKSRSHRAHRHLAEMLGHLRSGREPASRGVG